MASPPQRFRLHVVDSAMGCKGVRVRVPPYRTNEIRGYSRDAVARFALASFHVLATS